MRITKEQLKQIIKEELESLISEMIDPVTGEDPRQGPQQTYQKSVGEIIAAIYDTDGWKNIQPGSAKEELYSQNIDEADLQRALETQGLGSEIYVFIEDMLSGY